jgi:hypothetical protein
MAESQKQPTARRAGLVRWVWRSTIALMLGVVLTVVVSWGFALWGGFAKADLHTSYDEPLGLKPPIKTPEGWVLKTWHWWSGVGIRRDLLSEAMWMGSTLGYTSGAGPQRTRIVIRCGWPFMAMEWLNWSGDLPGNNASTLTTWWWMGVDVGLTAPPRGGNDRRHGVDPRLPIRPVAAGFVANTVFYAVVVMGAWWASGRVRRFIRRRRRLCEACAYPISGPVCPECGLAAPSGGAGPQSP